MSFREKPMDRSLTTGFLLTFACILLWHGEQSTAQPVFQSGPEVEVTPDGLHPLEPSIMGAAWLREEADLARYTRVYPMPTAVQFREVLDRRHTVRSMETAAAFHVSDERQAQLRQLFRDSFNEALRTVRAFEPSDVPGRDVLLVQALLTDVISGVPPDFPGSVVTNIRWAWEANIVLELRDSMSDQVLARTVERQRMDGPFDATIVSALTPSIVDRWSRLLVRRLEALRGFYPSRLSRLEERNRE